MAKKEYTLQEQVDWLKKKLAGSKTVEKTTKKGKKKQVRVDADGKPIKKSGCVLVDDYKDKDGNHTGKPMLWGWRLSKKFGFQSFTAYLGKDDGAPQNGTSKDVCLIFVVNMKVEGIGRLPAQTGVWSMQHKKLSITDAALVANPHAPRGGYFGRGGSRFKDKATGKA